MSTVQAAWKLTTLIRRTLYLSLIWDISRLYRYPELTISRVGADSSIDRRLTRRNDGVMLSAVTN